MIGLVLLTGLTAVAVMVLVGSALTRSWPADAPDPDHHRRPGTDPGTAPAPAPAPAPPPRPGREVLSLRAHLAFVHSPDPGTVVLDCTLDELDDDPDGTVPPGTPFTLQLKLPETTWFAASLELLLEQWAEECRQVEVALLARDGQARAKVGDGTSRVILEVDAAAGLSVG